MNRSCGCLLFAFSLASASTSNAVAADLRSELHWRVAPAAAAAAPQDAGVAGPSLEEIAGAAKKGPAAARKSPPPVVEGESFPLPYRPILRRYFDAMQSHSG